MFNWSVDNLDNVTTWLPLHSYLKPLHFRILNERILMVTPITLDKVIKIRLRKLPSSFASHLPTTKTILMIVIKDIKNYWWKIKIKTMKNTTLAIFFLLLNIGVNAQFYNINDINLIPQIQFGVVTVNNPVSSQILGESQVEDGDQNDLKSTGDIHSDNVFKLLRHSGAQKLPPPLYTCFHHDTSTKSKCHCWQHSHL